MSMKRRFITAVVITLGELSCLWFYLNVNWVIGGIMMVVVTPVAVLAIIPEPAKPPTTPKTQIISQASLALALKEAIEFAKVNANGDISVSVTDVTNALSNHRVGQE